MTLNDLVTPLLIQHKLGATRVGWRDDPQRENHSEPHVNWYTQDLWDSWIATVYTDHVEVRDCREDLAVVTSHRLNAADPDFLAQFDSDIKTALEWMKR